ncbi:retinol dehydrogenase 11-like [Diadema setosum]|uniref:retinol dehydrogenase 11-like n=1 Tax=Diadema setosum TaxID=31175 RepID=UPI003B3BCF84
MSAAEQVNTSLEVSDQEPTTKDENSAASPAGPGPETAEETKGTKVKEEDPPSGTAEDKTAVSGSTPTGAEETQQGPNKSKEEEPQTVFEGEKVVIITGANSGIGLIAAQLFATNGCDTIIACRSEEKATAAIAQIKQKVPSGKVTFMKLDLGSLQSVREFVDAFHAMEKPLHILCNNAGLTTGFSVKQRSETEDKFEMTFGVNHLGHFLLTNLLMEDLKKTARCHGEARIISTSSLLHDPDRARGKKAHLDFDNLMMDKPGTFDGEVAYCNSKLANCAFSVELSRRLDGTNVTTNTICPGFIPSTGLSRNESLGTRIKLTIVIPLLKLFGVTRTVQHGGSLLYDVATNQQWKGVTGKHFSDFKEMLSSEESREVEVGKRLWDVSADLTNCPEAKTLGVQGS